jgi:hypothetical protein
MWMAPVMENQQLLATNTPEARRALTQDALKAAMAFGGADITKEQRAAWEAENAEYRRVQEENPFGHKMGPGTRVQYRPEGSRADPSTWTTTEIGKPGSTRKMVPHSEGVIVTPGTPEAGEPGVGVWRDPVHPPTPQHVAVRGENDRHWFWRHRNDLEVLPPREEFPVGTQVEYVTHSPGRAGVLQQPWEHAEVHEPPPGSKPHGRDWVWVDYVAHGDMPVKHRYGGGWYHKDDLVKLTKKK